MLIIIETIFSLISLVVLTSLWVFLASVFSFYLKKLLKINGRRINVVVYSILVGTLLEIILAAASILISSFQEYNNNTNAGILSGLEKGSNISILLTPISSIIGVVIGVKKTNPPWGRF